MTPYTTLHNLCGIQTQMTDKSCPKRVRLVERLARAINKKKHTEAESSSSNPEKIAAEQELKEAMEAVRTQSAEDLCGPKRGKQNEQTA
jgi:hypothetical protein